MDGSAALDRPVLKGGAVLGRRGQHDHRVCRVGSDCLADHDACLGPFVRIIDADEPRADFNAAARDRLVDIVKRVLDAPDIGSGPQDREAITGEARRSLNAECAVARRLNRDVFLQPVADRRSELLGQQSVSHELLREGRDIYLPIGDNRRAEFGEIPEIITAPRVVIAAVAMAKRMARALSRLRFGYQERLHPRIVAGGPRAVSCIDQNPNWNMAELRSIDAH
jgi:hypothetical protein